MKERIAALRARLDAISLRERVMVFGACAAFILFLFHSLFLNPLLARQAALRLQIGQHQNHIEGINEEIKALVQAASVDPDQQARAHLAALRADATALGDSLRAMQNGLIAPERVAPLLEAMLKENGRLKLVGLKTLPVTILNTGAADKPAAPHPDVAALAPPLAKLAEGAAPAPGPAAVAKPVALLYRHGVELTVRGNYLDMVDYMATLEAMPARVIWGRADLTVEQYPTSRLTLTVYTLGLDEKWMKL